MRSQQVVLQRDLVVEHDGAVETGEVSHQTQTVSAHLGAHATAELFQGVVAAVVVAACVDLLVTVEMALLAEGLAAELAGMSATARLLAADRLYACKDLCQ